jgi:hypothetical protein
MIVGGADIISGTILVYVAGSYTASTRCQVMANVQRAREVAERVARARAFPITPHFLGDGIEDVGGAVFWYEGTLELMRRCDAVVVVPGSENSRGTRIEIATARGVGLPVFFAERYSLSCSGESWMSDAGDEFAEWIEKRIAK